MIVRYARQGFNTKGEFWGCEEHFSTGCRGSRPVPSHEWDWFGFVPIPVSIIENQIKHYQDSGLANRVNEDQRDIKSKDTCTTGPITIRSVGCLGRTQIMTMICGNLRRQ